MNFTKQYIELCKNDKVQGLRKKLEHGDWFFDLDAEEFEKKINIMTNDIDDINFGDNFVWLPTGDQLDEEIVKICKANNYRYLFCYVNMSGYKNYEAYVNDDNYNQCEYFNEDNPLIAKIKLLIALLEEE